MLTLQLCCFSCTFPLHCCAAPVDCTAALSVALSAATPAPLLLACAPREAQARAAAPKRVAFVPSQCETHTRGLVPSHEWPCALTRVALCPHKSGLVPSHQAACQGTKGPQPHLDAVNQVGLYEQPPHPAVVTLLRPGTVQFLKPQASCAPPPSQAVASATVQLGGGCHARACERGLNLACMPHYHTLTGS